ncbi:MAG TPA: ABC transporter permease [Vicinamibacterales bacterium]|jgi:putative ABC transport system permease protein
MLPSVRVAVQTLRANPVRTLLSTLGIVMGAASLVGVLSLGDGAEAFAREQIERRGLQVIAIAPRMTDTVDGLTVPRSSYPTFRTENVQALRAAVMRGSSVVMTVEGAGTFVTRSGGANRAAMVTGIIGSPSAAGLSVVYGRFLSDEEMTRGTKAVVVSNRLARELAGAADASTIVGAVLTLQANPWTIVGVLEAFPGERTFAAVVPFEAASLAMMPAPTPRVPRILVNAPRVEDVTAVRSQVETWADTTDRRWRADSQVSISATGLDRLQQLNQGIRVFKMLMGAFTAISLVVGGIGIMNVLLASVVERTREIGVRRATGARRRDIVVQFLAESVVISLAGAMLGALLGMAAAFVTTAIMRSQTSAPIYAAATWQTFIVSMAAAIVVGLVFGTYPAFKAARLSPIDAMRYE